MKQENNDPVLLFPSECSIMQSNSAPMNFKIAVAVSLNEIWKGLTQNWLEKKAGSLTFVANPTEVNQVWLIYLRKYMLF